jgi:archaellum component FlaF (FlaF/FlaG flagellin family)
MGVSVSASTAVLLVAALISFGVVYSAEDVAQDALLQAQQTMTERQQDMLATSIEIQLTYPVINETNEFLYTIISVKNTGNTVLDMNYVRLMVNGLFTEFNYTFLESVESSLWMPDEIVNLGISDEFGVDESNRIKIIVGNGVSDIRVEGGS